jgi:hypothetical protein
MAVTEWRNRQFIGSDISNYISALGAIVSRRPTSEGYKVSESQEEVRDQMRFHPYRPHLCS